MAALVLAGGLSVCVVFGPAWVTGNGSGLTAADRLAAENDVRSTFVHGGVADDVGGAGSELERVDLRDAELDGLDIPRVCFAHSNLDRARLAGARLGRGTRSDALLREADLSGADLRGADLTRAGLDGAILLGVDLTDAELGDASVRGVIADSTTTWPAGFTPPGPDD